MKKNAAGKQKETGIRTQKQAYLFLAPSLIILTVFVFVPLVGAIAISLMNINIYMNDISFAGLKNYLKMFTLSQKYFRIIVRTENTVNSSAWRVLYRMKKYFSSATAVYNKMAET